jgi:hypothetical protein
MAVLLPTDELTVKVRAHPELRDAHGVPVAPVNTDPEVRGPYPGAVKEGLAGTWSIRLDPRVWRVWPDDEVTDGTRTWIIRSAQLNEVPGYSDADYIAVTAVLDPPLVP